jgi:hypothetical protein
MSQTIRYSHFSVSVSLQIDPFALKAIYPTPLQKCELKMELILSLMTIIAFNNVSRRFVVDSESVWILATLFAGSQLEFYDGSGALYIVLN